MKITENIEITNCKHEFKEFWKTNYYGKLKLKEIKCIYCYEKKYKILKLLNENTRKKTRTD